jgi:hypothetical protein
MLTEEHRAPHSKHTPLKSLCLEGNISVSSLILGWRAKVENWNKIVTGNLSARKQTQYSRDRNQKCSRKTDIIPRSSNQAN